MPFTPFHFGPGLLIKSAIPNHFSLSIFALANVAMDIEPLVRMWRGDAQLHGASHTLIGAVLIGAIVALAGRPLVMHAWQWYGRWSSGARVLFPLTWGQAWLGALLGTLSHLLLDAVMHADMHPFLPLTDFNPLLEISWTQNVYLACLFAGMAGVMLGVIRAAFKPERN